MKRWFPKIDIWVIMAPLLCFGGAWYLAGTEIVKRFEWRTLDWRTQVRADWGQPGPDPTLVVIGVGDHSTVNLGPWPFPRGYHAILQNFMVYGEPKVLAWDIIFQDRVDRDGVPWDGDSDSDFSATTSLLSDLGIPVVFAAVSSSDPTGDDLSFLGATGAIDRIEGDVTTLLGADYGALPFPGIRAKGLIGAVDAPRGAGGIVRQMPMLIKMGEQVFPSLSLQAVMQYWGIAPQDIRAVLGDGIYLGTGESQRRIPIDSQGTLAVNYRYEPMQPGDEPGSEMPTVEYFNLLVDLEQKFGAQVEGAREPESLKDRIVLVGEFSTDSGPTPRSDNSPLVYLHANVINNILQNDYQVRADAKWVWGIALAVGGLGAWVSRRYSIILATVFTAVVLAAFVWICFALWMQSSIWVTLVAPILGFVSLQFVVVVHRVLSEQKAKAEMRGMFGSYLAPVVVKRMVDSGEQPALGGVNEEITAYFSDIQSFSAFSEILTASQLVELLNEYLTACTDIIQESGGTLDKYIGDAVVAMFGAPVDQTDHAYQACLTTLRIQQRLDELREKWTSEGDKWPELVHQMRTRIGLNTGECMIGNMGSRSRFNYTMMGDNVNLAARMESGAKSWGAFNMVSQATRDRCEAAVGGDEIVFRPLGRIKVAGRTQPVPIHEISGVRAEMTAQHLECLARFGAGLEKYHRQDWEGAAEEFTASALLEPLQPERDAGVKANPSTVYQRIVQEMAAKPPGAEWDGVYVMAGK